MASRRILIITYYWPPSGGSGVQRWLKFAKYLVRKEWEPFVFTPENPSFTIKDASLLKDVPDSVEVIRFPIWEPYQIFFKLSSLFGKKNIQQTDFVSTGKKSFLQSVSGWIRGNLFIPDARVFWVKPSVEYLLDFIARNNIDKIITTGPPHSVHLIGLRLKKKNPALTWLADFRDPWSEWDLLDTLSLSSFARKRHTALEREVLTLADKVITIAPYHVKRFEALGGRKVELITNGFDEEDFQQIQKVRTSKFTIRHTGVVDELRDPRPIMEAIKAVCSTNTEFAGSVEVEFIGKVNAAFKSYVAGDAQLNKITRFTDHLPHSELLKLYGSTDVQMLVLAHTSIAPGNLPGKFFEYLASGQPILGTGPADGDAAQILKETGAGVIVEVSDKAGLNQALIQLFNNWQQGVKPDPKSIARFTRNALTDQLIKLLE